MIEAHWTDFFCLILDHISGNQAFHIAYRWAHYLAAAVFVGLLIFLNLLLPSGPAGRENCLDRALLQKVFWLWRWAAMLFCFTGLNLLHMLYNVPSANHFFGDKGLWMVVGASLGLFSWGLVWFWIHPAQRRHFLAWEAQGHVDQPLARRSAYGIRVLTALLAPLLMGMVVGGHGLTLFSWGWRDVAWTLALGSLPVAAVYAWIGRKDRASL